MNTKEEQEQVQVVAADARKDRSMMQETRYWDQVVVVAQEQADGGSSKNLHNLVLVRCSCHQNFQFHKNIFYLLFAEVETHPQCPSVLWIFSKKNSSVHRNLFKK